MWIRCRQERLSNQPTFRVLGRVSIKLPEELKQPVVVLEGEFTLPFAPFPGLVLQGEEITVYNDTWGFSVDARDLVRSNGAVLGYIVDGMVRRLELAGWRKMR